MKRLFLFAILIAASFAVRAQGDDDALPRKPDCIYVDTAYAVPGGCTQPPFNSSDTCYFWRVRYIRNGILDFYPTEEYIRRSKIIQLSEIYILPSGFLLDKQKQTSCKAE